MDPILYRRIDKEVPMRPRFSYVEPDDALDAPTIPSTIDDVGIMPTYDAWWNPRGINFHNG